MPTEYLVLYVMRKWDGQKSDLGISVSKKVGNSVVRHHLTRLDSRELSTSRRTFPKRI